MVALEINKRGLRRVIIYARTDKEQQQAHQMLADVAPELKNLDSALKRKATKKGVK